MHKETAKTDWMLAIVLVIAGLGAFFRLHNIADQILVDDEWHGNYYVLGKSLPYLLTHFSVPGATCIPLNFWRALLLRTAGWSELLLRFPSLLAGILTVLVMPLLARRSFSARATWIFALLLACSPFLIFYSRMCRPYSLVVFLSGTALLASLAWIREGKIRYALVYVLCSSLAIYCHLFAGPVVVAPGVVLCLQHAIRRWKRDGDPIPGLKSVLLACAALAILSAALVGPALIHSLRTTMPSLVGVDKPTLWTARLGLSLLAGTHALPLCLLLLFLVGTGLVIMVRQRRPIAAIAITGILLLAGSLIVMSPHGTHAPIVLMRYCIALYPVVFLLAAVGLDSLLAVLERTVLRSSERKRMVLGNTIAASIPAALLLAGPVLHLTFDDNSFTNHVAYQQVYGPQTCDRSFTSHMTPPDFKVDLIVERDEVSPFFTDLASEHHVESIVQYPMLVGDHFNPHYYYQRFHGKRVIIGYVTTDRHATTNHPSGAGSIPNRTAKGLHVYGNTYVDEIVTGVPSEKIRLRNMVDMSDLAGLRATRASYVVLHRMFEAQLPLIYGENPCIADLEEFFRSELGPPYFESQHLVVYKLD